MHRLYFILSVALMMLVTVFALTNNTPITVNIFGFAELESNVTVVMFACMAGGVILRSFIDSGKQYSEGFTDHS